MNDIDPLLALHRRFCEVAGDIDPNDLRYHKFWSRHFYEFHREKFTSEEMVLVIRYVQAQNKKASEPKFRRRIDPPSLIGNLERFCNDLVDAKRIEALRLKRTCPREQTIAEFRGYRREDTQDSAKSLSDVMKIIRPL